MHFIPSKIDLAKTNSCDLPAWKKCNETNNIILKYSNNNNNIFDTQNIVNLEDEPLVCIFQRSMSVFNAPLVGKDSRAATKLIFKYKSD